MSRTLKRVPMDFEWPLKAVWGGYVNPYWKLSAECPHCENGFDRDGGRPDANAALFHDQWYGKVPFDSTAYGAEPIRSDHPAIWDIARQNIERAPEYYMTSDENHARLKFMQDAYAGFPGDERALIPFPTFDRELAITREAQRLHDQCFRDHWCHHLIQTDVDALLAHNRLWDFTRVPHCAEHAFIVAIRMAFHGTNSWLPEGNGCHPTAAEVNAWSLRGFGHDASNAAICIEARCAREGVPYMCARCAGSGHVWPTSEIEQQYEDWRPTDPPTGDGYQLWENVSEGSPVSPVFASLDALCAWCEENASTFAHHRATKEKWRSMLEDDFVHAEDERGNIFL